MTMPELFDPYHRWLGIPPKDQPPNHYRLLGLERFESDVEVIRDAVEQRMAHVRTYQLARHSELSQKILNELAAAKACLLDPESKAAYDVRLRSEPSPADQAKPPGLPLRWKKPAVTAAVVLVLAGLVLAAVAWMRPGRPSETSSPAAVESRPGEKEKVGQLASPPIAERGKSPSPPLAVAPFDASKAREHQEAWAKHIGEPVEITTSIGIRLILIPPGAFLMGSGDFERTLPQEKPQHRVRITRPFRLAAHEVTVGQFAAFADAAGYRTEAEAEAAAAAHNGAKKKAGKKPSPSWRKPVFVGLEQTPDHPVVWVSWNDAVQFCAWLSAKEGKKIRVPTEAEWEYAARAGTQTRFPNGDDPEKTTQIGNLADAALKAKSRRKGKTLLSSDGYANTAPVGSFAANGFGLHDMLGNVLEMCSDWYSVSYYAESHENDPTGPAIGERRVARGASWAIIPLSLAERYPLSMSSRISSRGFRVVCEVGERER